MARVLVSALPASGHINPLLAIAQALHDHDHEVAFSTDTSFKMQLLRAGFSLYPMAYPPGSVEKAHAAFSQPATWLSQFTLHPPQSFFFRHLDILTKSLIEAIDSFKPDVMLADLNQYASPIAAEARQLPYAGYFAIVNPILSRDAPPFGMGLDYTPPNHWKRRLWPVLKQVLPPIFARYDRIVNRVRQSYDLPLAHGSLLAHSPYLTMAPVTEAYEYPRSDLPPEVMYIGPVTTKQRGEIHDDFPWDFFDDPCPTIYVSMGTIVQGEKIFRQVIELACTANWKAVIAVGRGSDPAAYGPLPPNVIVHQFVPQLEILKHVDGVISHGGNNTVTETLLAGLPLVVIPISADQPDSAAHVAASGAGIRLSPWRVNRERLGKAIGAILSDPTYREAAQRIQKDYKATDGPQTAARLISILADSQCPVRRPPNMSPTIYPEDVDKLIPEMNREVKREG